MRATVLIRNRRGHLGPKTSAAIKIRMGLLTLSLTLALLNQLIQGSQVVGTYDLMLDPGRIYWWQTKWMADPITLSKSNAGANGVSITFNFNPSTSLTNGIFEVSFPSAFSVSSMAVVGGTNPVTVTSGLVQMSGVTYVAGVDTSLTFTGLGMPSTTGGYGPIALRSRFTTNGQVIDCNLSFGVIYATPTETKITTGTSVSFVPTQSTNIINKSNNVLSFKFTISRDLWKHDMFRITTSSYFKVVMSNSFMCSSMNYGGFINNFNGTETGNPWNLDCVASDYKEGSSQMVWVYGLNTEYISASLKDNTQVDIRVPGFTNPTRNMDTSSYIWVIDTVRFGSTNVLDSATVTGPATATDSVGSVTWRPTWGLPSTSIVSGLTIFMDITVAMNNPVNEGGSLVIVSSDNSGTWASSNSCVVLSNSLKSSATTNACSASGGTITVSDLSAQASGAIVMLRYLSTFSTTTAGTSAKLTSVTTKWSDGKEVDKSLGVAPFTIPLATAAYETSTFTVNFFKTGAATSDAAGGSGTVDQFIAFTLTATAQIATSTVTISCPLSSSASSTTSSDDFMFMFASTAPIAKADTAAVTTTAGGSQITVTKTNGTMSTASTGLPQYTPGTLVVSNPTASTTVSFGIYYAATSVIYLPRVMNNIMTAYECSVQATDTAGLLVVGVAQFAITGQSSTVTADFYCANPQIIGTPLLVTFKPLVLDLLVSTSTKKYYLELDLPTDRFTGTFHGSGVSNNDQYPMDTNLSTGAVMTVSSNAASTGNFAHLITGLGNVATTSSAAEIVFPVQSVTAGTFQVTAHTFYTLTSDVYSIRYYTHSGSASAASTAASAKSLDVVDATRDPTTASNQNIVTGTSLGSNAYTFTVKLAGAISADSYFWLIFPRGFAFSSLRDVLSSNPSASSSFPLKRFFSSPKSNFAFPGILIKESFTGTQISSTASTTISISGLIAPLGAYTQDETITWVHAALTGVTTAACAYRTAGLKVNVQAGTITTLTVSPSTIYAQGPNGVDINHTIQVTLPHGIDAGGSIIFTIDTAWTYTVGISSCTVTGINGAVCTQSGSSYTIASFSDFSTITNQSITIYLNRMLPPTNVLSTSTYQFVKTFITYTSTSIATPAAIIDSYPVSTGAIVTVYVGIPAGVGTFNSIRVLPPNAGTTDNDLYMSFYMQYDLPSGSVVSVAIPSGYTAISGGTANNNKCWVSPLTYTACSVQSSVSFTISQSYQALSVLEVFVRHALSPPTDVPAASTNTIYPFKISASWQGATIITDPGAPYSGAQLTVPSGKVSTLITATTPAISVFPRNQGELATYIFTFTLNVAFNETDVLYIIWPDEYDPYIGEATQMQSQEPGNFYLPCTSSMLGAVVWCRVDHNIMIVSGSTSLGQTTAISLTVQSVRNPPTGTTNPFRVYHYSDTLMLREWISSLGTVAITGSPSLIEIRNLAVTNRVLSSTADYSMILYLTGSFDTSTQLQIQFPKEYDLTVVDQKDSYSCATQWVDFASTATITTPQEWNSGSGCNQANNWVTMTSPSATKTFLATNYLTWNITSVMTPTWGYERLTTPATSKVQDFDIQDWSVWTIYSYWTSKFNVFAYVSSSSNQQYLAKSYSHTSGAYLGFMENLRMFVVNGYKPQTRANRIVVWPGTQTTDLAITTVNSTWPLQAKKITFSPATNSRTPDASALKYTSFRHAFIMQQEEWQINFRVAAARDSVKGLYYMNLKLEETVQPGIDKGLYVAPPPTLVEIAPFVAGKYAFAVSSVPSVTVGTTSIPIGISVSNAPHTSVEVNIAVQAVPSVTVEPAVLTFGPDINQLFFYVLVSADHDVTIYPSAVVTFTLSSTDAGAYSIQPAVLVPIQSSGLFSSGTITKVGIANIAKTSVTIAPTTDQLGTLYYLVEPEGAKILSFQEMKALIPTFVKADTDFTSEETANSQDRTNFEADPNGSETWEAFQTRLYLNHVTTFQRYGAIAMTTTVTSTPISVQGLYAATDYQVTTYFDNLNPNNTSPAMRTEYFTTLATAECQPIYVRFQYTVSESFATSIYNILAKYLGINPVRLTERVRTTERYVAGTRVLQAESVANSTSSVAFTVFSSNILPNRALENPSPTTIATLSNEAVNNMQQDFIAASIANQMWNYGPLSIPTHYPPQWDRSPQIQSFSNTSIIVEFLSTVNGESCCVALLETNVNLQPEQVYYNYDYNWTSTIGECVTSNISLPMNSLTLGGLEPDTNYFVHCVATDDYPLWPTQMSYTSTMPIPFIPLHTPITLDYEPEIVGAARLVLSLLALTLL